MDGAGYSHHPFRCTYIRGRADDADDDACGDEEALNYYPKCSEPHKTITSCLPRTGPEATPINIYLHSDLRSKRPPTTTSPKIIIILITTQEKDYNIMATICKRFHWRFSDNATRVDL